jgi:hypothetical protein
MGASTWQKEVLKAAASWAQYANLNFAVKTDLGADMGSGSYIQGNPFMADVRISGYNFYDSALGLGFMPPNANTNSVSGDIQFNTGGGLGIGSSYYDLYTVALHEFGHSLGLGHGTSGTAMNPLYQSLMTGLSADDIAGIQAIYGVRQNDTYDNTASNASFATATNLTSYINSSTKTLNLNDFDITTTSDMDYVKFTVPTGMAGNINISLTSSNLSLLAPKMWVYGGSQNQLTTKSSTAAGATLTYTISNAAAGNTYYIKVDGNDNTAFGVGRYGLAIGFGGVSSPVLNLPDTTVYTPEGGGGNGGGLNFGRFGSSSSLNSLFGLDDVSSSSSTTWDSSYYQTDSVSITPTSRSSVVWIGGRYESDPVKAAEHDSEHGTGSGISVGRFANNVASHTEQGLVQVDSVVEEKQVDSGLKSDHASQSLNGRRDFHVHVNHDDAHHARQDRGHRHDNETTKGDRHSQRLEVSGSTSHRHHHHSGQAHQHWLDMVFNDLA